MSGLTSLILALLLALTAFLSLSSGAVALGLVTCATALEMSAQGVFGVFASNRTLFNYLIAIIVTLSILRQLFTGGRIFSGMNNPVTWCLGLLLLLSASSIAWSPVPVDGKALVIKGLPYTVLYLLLAPLLVGTLREFRIVPTVVILIGLATTVAVLMNPRSSLQAGRLYVEFSDGGVSSPLALGNLGALMFIYALLYRPEGFGRYAFPFRIAAGLLGLGLALQSGSRGQVMFAIFLGVVLYPISQRIGDVKKFFLLVFTAGIGAIGVLLTMRLFIGGDNIERWSTQSLSDGWTGRIEMLFAALGSFLEQPSAWLLGRGANAFREIRPDHAYVHNAPVEALTELGIVGFALYIIILATGFHAARTLWRYFRDKPLLRPALACLFATVLFHTLTSLKQGSIHSPSSIMFVLLIMARIARNETKARMYAEEEPEYDEEEEDLEYDEDLGYDTDHHASPA